MSRTAARTLLMGVGAFLGFSAIVGMHEIVYSRIFNQEKAERQAVADELPVDAGDHHGELVADPVASVSEGTVPIDSESGVSAENRRVVDPSIINEALIEGSSESVADTGEAASAMAASAARTSELDSVSRTGPITVSGTAAGTQADQSSAPTITWSAVWRPFYSPATANGFADYISKSTGLDLRVTESRVAGQYLVEVQHGSEAEWLDADRRIVEATGYRPVDALR